MKLTIIIAVFNMRDTLARAIESVIRQSYDNYELILMDGGSTDGTLEVIQQYRPYISHFESGKDGGHCAACNKAIDIATGDFILLLNADDILLPNTLADIAAAHHSSPTARVIAFGAMIASSLPNHQRKVSKVIKNKKVLNLTLENMLFNLPLINAKAFDRSLFSEFGKFKARFVDNTYYISNDREFMIRLVLHHVQAHVIPKPLYLYFSHEDSLTFSTKNLIKIQQEHIHLANQLLNTATLTPQQRRLIQAWHTRDNIALCYFLARAKDFSGTFRLFIDTLRQNPLASLRLTIYLTYRVLSNPIRKKLTHFKNKKYQLSISDI